jgi:hypothetical protein
MRKTGLQIKKDNNTNTVIIDAIYVETEYLITSEYTITVRQNLFTCNNLLKSREEAYRSYNHRKKLLGDNVLPEAESLRFQRIKHGDRHIDLVLVVCKLKQGFKKKDEVSFEECDHYVIEGRDEEKVRKGRAFEANLFKKRYGIAKLQYATKVPVKKFTNK